MNPQPDYLVRLLKLHYVRPSRIIRYGFALIITLTVILLKVQLGAVIGNSTPFLLVFIAVIFSAWFGGLGPGLVSTAVSLVAVFYIFIDRTNLLPINSTQSLQMIVFGLQGVIISILSEISKQSHLALARSSTIYEQLLSTESDLGEGVIFIEDNKVIYSNEAVSRIGGYTQGEMKDLDFIIDRIVPDQQLEVRDRLAKRLAGQPLGDRYETAILDKWGRRVELEIAIKMIRFGKHIHLIILVHDITERKIFEEALRRSEEHYRLLVENVKDYAIFTLKKNGDIASWNEGAERILGYEESEVIGKHFSTLIPASERDGALFDELKAAEQQGRAVLEGWRVKKNGTLFYASGVVTPLWNERGKLRGFVKVLQDITEQKKSEEKIKHQALHDALTDLPNRTLFADRVSQAIAVCERTNQMAAVLFIDLDKFKNINDTLGHGIGDLLLKEVAQRLSNSVRKEDTIARLGGDEFTILLPHIKSLDNCIKAAKKVSKAIRPTFHIDGRELHISASIGIAIYPQDGEDVQTLLKNADVALYGAKDQGRDIYQLYTPTLNSNAGVALALENDLRQALDRGEFLLHYQPMLDATTRQLVGVEALVRWNHPTLGIISPAEFIPIAEENGTIIPLNEWIIRTACKQNKAWQNHGLPPIRMAVNISARQFTQKNLVERVTRILHETSLQPTYLELEVTESFAMSNIDLTVQRLRELKRMGVSIAIDDFGTGHSSLNYLKHLPITTLKIDRSFVRNCVNDRQDAEIIKAIITIGHSLNLSVVAEGVENSLQLDYLHSLSCDIVQGFLFSEAIPPEAIVEMLQKQQTLSEIPA